MVSARVLDKYNKIASDYNILLNFGLISNNKGKIKPTAQAFLFLENSLAIPSFYFDSGNGEFKFSKHLIYAYEIIKKPRHSFIDLKTAAPESILN